jgi:hypothetical protein
LVQTEYLNAGPQCWSAKIVKVVTG